MVIWKFYANCKTGRLFVGQCRSPHIFPSHTFFHKCIPCYCRIWVTLATWTFQINFKFNKWTLCRKWHCFQYKRIQLLSLWLYLQASILACIKFLYARLINGRIMPWQCPSVCPSVRPRFPDFSWTCFEISIWNLVSTFSRWNDMSSLSCITIGSLWLSLQPKVGQTHFLQSWPHKSR